MKKLFPLFVFVFLLACNKQVPLKVTFTELDASTSASLRGLFVVNESVIWASGSEGTVLLSTDGGENWNAMKVPGAESNDFRSIHAWNENRAIVFGVLGPDFGYLTEDGGQNWQVIYRDSTAGLFFNSLKFADNKTGLAISDPVDGTFFVIKTTDGGVTWGRIDSLPPVEQDEANFAASNTCIEFLPSGSAWIASGGQAARVFYSNDVGENWKVAKTPMIRGTVSSGIFSVTFRNEREGIVVGGIYDQPEITTNIAAYTTDGGLNWQPAQTMPAGYRSCVQYITAGGESFAFAIGKTGCDYSFDGGQNWKHLSDEGYYTFRAVPGKAIGFAAGSGGRIFRVDFQEM